MDLTTPILILLVLVIPLLPLLEKYRKRKKIRELVDKIPGDKTYPIVGTSWSLIRAGRNRLFEEYRKRNAKYSSIFRTWSGTKPLVHVKKPEHIEVILSSNVNIQKGMAYKFFKKWLGDGLVSSYGNHWKTHRKLLTPAFHFSILDNFSTMFAAKGEKLAEYIQPYADTDTYVDLMPLISRCALDIICETAMGIKICALENADSQYAKALSGVMDTIMRRILNPLVHSDFIFYLTKDGKYHEECCDILHKFTLKVIEEKKKAFQEKYSSSTVEMDDEDVSVGRKKKLAFLDLMIRASQTTGLLSDEDMKYEVNTFVFTGHDTTAITVSWVLYALATNPKVQDAVFNEIYEIFEGDLERPVTPQDINKLKYLERVVKETLRLYTLVPAVTRTLSEKVVIENYEIPAGVECTVQIYEVHHDPDIYPDPFVFDPDRFLPENIAKRHAFSFIPFSAGPRNCIGQKFGTRNNYTLLTCLLRKYKFSALVKPEDMKYFFDATLKPQGGMKLKVERR